MRTRLVAIIATMVIAAGSFVIGRVTAPSSQTSLARALRPFAGPWYWHGQGVQIRSDGTGTATWRVYTWCTESPAPACDGLVGHAIIDGGNAAFVLTAVRGSVAWGRIIQTSDPKVLRVGSLRIQLA